LRRDLYSNIVLSGGTTMLPNLPERLHAELVRIAPNDTKVKMVGARRPQVLGVGRRLDSRESLNTFGRTCT
jgi:actin-related protein